jgi:hypothetical protein
MVLYKQVLLCLTGELTVLVDVQETYQGVETKEGIRFRSSDGGDLCEEVRHH